MSKQSPVRFCFHWNRCLISQVTDAISEEVLLRQNRPFDEVCSIVVWRYHLSKDLRTIPTSMLHAAKVKESTDSERPLFRCLFTLTDGSTVTIAEEIRREQCYIACARFNMAIGK